MPTPKDGKITINPNWLKGFNLSERPPEMAPQVPTSPGMPQVDTSLGGILQGVLAGLTSLHPVGAGMNIAGAFLPPPKPYEPTGQALEWLWEHNLPAGPQQVLMGVGPGVGKQSLVKQQMVENPRYFANRDLYNNLRYYDQGQHSPTGNPSWSMSQPQMLTNRTSPVHWTDSLQWPLEKIAERGLYDIPPTIPSEYKPTYFSNLAQAFDNPKIPNKLTPEQALAVIEKSPGVKAEEAKWVFGDPKRFLSQKTKWTKQELLDHIKSHEVDVVEVPSKLDPATVGNESRPKPTFSEWLENNQYELVDEPLYYYEGDGPYTRTGILDQEGYGEIVANMRDEGITRSIQPEDYQQWLDTNIRNGRIAQLNTPHGYYRSPSGFGRHDYLIEQYGENPYSGANRHSVGTGEFDPKWGPSGQYNQPLTLPNPQNYRERLLVWGNKPNRPTSTSFGTTFSNPEDVATHFNIPIEEATDIWNGRPQDNFHSSHFDSANILAHIRTTDRLTPDGKRILFIEEAQSDWQKALREMDKSGQDPRTTWEYRASKILHEKGLGEHAPLTQDQLYHIDRSGQDTSLLTSNPRGWTDPNNPTIGGSTPDAPLARDYPNLVMKRILRLAAEEGYDGVGWTTGKQQAERYNQLLMEGVQKVDYDLGKQQLTLSAKNGTTKTVSATVRDLPGMVGQEAAEKLLQNAAPTIVQVSRPTEGLIHFTATPVRTREGTELWQWTGRNSGDPYSPMYSSYDELIQHPVTQENFRRARLNRMLETPQEFVEGGEVLPNGHYVTGYDNPISSLQQYVNTTTTKSSIEAPDLLVGERGYSDVYDRQLRGAADRIGKQFGSRTEKGQINLSSEPTYWNPDKLIADGTILGTAPGPLPGTKYYLDRTGKWLTPAEVMKKYGTVDTADAHIHLLTPTLRTHATTKGFPLFQILPPVVGATAGVQYLRSQQQDNKKKLRGGLQ